MFAVKGWSIDPASLKPQTEAVKAGKSAGADGEKKQGRKRKRGDPKPTQHEDVEKLWDEHIEGKEPVKTKSAKRKDRKQQKLDHPEEGEVGNGNTPNTPRQLKCERKNEVAGDPPSAIASAGKRERKSKIEHGKDESGSRAPRSSSQDASKNVPPPAPPLPQSAKLTPMQAAMRQKLVSARFRHLNETLYTAPSDTALGLFDQNPEMFEDYHAGFRQQVSIWPENPVDTFISTLRSRGKIKPPSFKDKKSKNDATDDGSAKVLPRTHGTAIIADLGCGDARIAQTLKDSGEITKLNFKINSYDLHSPSPLITKADISSIPTPDGSMDVAIFCLALMGTNWISFIEEAYRILHWKGELWVAEIKSRFGRVGKAGKVVEHSVGNKRKQAVLKKAQEIKKKEDEEFDEHAALRTEVDGVETKQVETDVSAFVDVLRRRGFVLKDGDKSVDLSNKMFVKMEFIKATAPTKGKGVVEAAPQTNKKKFINEETADIPTDDEAKVLKPCLYKIR